MIPQFLDAQISKMRICVHPMPSCPNRFEMHSTAPTPSTNFAATSLHCERIRTSTTAVVYDPQCSHDWRRSWRLHIMSVNIVLFPAVVALVRYPIVRALACKSLSNDRTDHLSVEPCCHDKKKLLLVKPVGTSNCGDSLTMSRKSPIRGWVLPSGFMKML